MKILVGSTIPTYKLDEYDESLAWLDTAEVMVNETKPDEIHFFASLETDARGREPFQPVTDRLAGLGGDWWWFSVDLGDEAVTSGTRLPRICTGRNLIIDRALAGGFSHVLFLDADLYVPAHGLRRLLDLDGPIVGGHVPQYCLDGPVVVEPNVRRHWNTAGFLLCSRDLLRSMRWGFDPDDNMTDDLWFAKTARNLGFGETLVDHDVAAKHKCLIPLENRNHDRLVRR